MKLRDPEKCPKCAGRGYVVESKRRVGYRRRVYTCRSCNIRWPAFLSLISPKRLIEMRP